MDEKELQGIKALAEKADDVPTKTALKIASEESLIAGSKNEKRFTNLEQKDTKIDGRINDLYVISVCLLLPCFIYFSKKILEEFGIIKKKPGK